MQPYAIVAGAGSGKTQTMGLRVAWLVANGQVEPQRVLGLTFTRKAAAELSQRVRRMLRGLVVAHEREPFLEPDVAAALAAGEPTVSTYHAYAAALVAEHALRAGLEPSARLLGEAMTWQYAARGRARLRRPDDRRRASADHGYRRRARPRRRACRAPGDARRHPGLTRGVRAPVDPPAARRRAARQGPALPRWRSCYSAWPDGPSCCRWSSGTCP